MSTPITITLTLATKEDIPALTTILSTSSLPEPIARFYFKSWPSLSALTPVFHARLTGRCAQPPLLTQIFKLTDDVTGEIVGTVCLSEECNDGDGEGEKPKEDIDGPKLGGVPVSLEEINLEFAEEMGRVFGGVERWMGGRRFLFITSFGVLPRYQGRGYGSLLLAKCNEIANERGLLLFLCALPSAYTLYLKFGFVEVARADLDLAKWAKPNSGFGIYSNFVMLREPKGKKGREV